MTLGKTIWLLLFLNTFTKVNAQNNIAENIIQQFESYNFYNFKEKVLVNTDKTFYLAGERIWFKAYITNASSNIALNLSKIAYFELISSENKPVLQAKIKIDKTGEGSLQLPLSIATGSYTLCAYTNWMKNFNPTYFYKQSINIVNTIKGSSLGFTTSNYIEDTGISFFPEGGNFVAGLTSTVVCKVIGKNGLGVSSNGIFINEKKEIEAHFKTDSSGFSSFTFTPNAHTSYTVVANIENDSVRLPFKEVINDEGYIMQLMQNKKEDNLITISISTTESFNNLPVYLFVQTNGTFKQVLTEKIKNGRVNFYIKKNELTDGLTHFTLFDNNKQPICERLYFNYSTKTEKFSLKTTKEIYSTREKVTVDILAIDNLGEIDDASLSMSVFLIDSLQELNYLDISKSIYDLEDFAEKKMGIINEKNNNTEKLIDNLMITKKWRGFKWDDILKNSKQAFNFLPEMEGQLIEGKITHTASGLPAEGITAYLSVLNKNFQFANAVSDKAGRIFFPIKEINGTVNIILQTNIYKDSGYTIEIINPFFEHNKVNHKATLLLSQSIKKHLLNRHIAIQVENTYHTDIKKINPSKSTEEEMPFYGQPSHSFMLDAYTRFNTIDEVLREITTDVKIRKKASHNNLRVFNKSKQVYFETAPLVLLDGIPVFDIEKLLALNPLKIKQIDVVAGIFFTGSIENNGVVSFITYDSDLGGYTLDKGTVSINIDGVQLQQKIYSPEYFDEITKNNRTPDLRNVLFWKSNLNLSTQLKTSYSFYTSDFKGTYAVVVKGILKNGTPVSSKLVFNVK